MRELGQPRWARRDGCVARRRRRLATGCMLGDISACRRPPLGAMLPAMLSDSALRTLVVISMASSITVLGCTLRSRRPDGPYREAQELVDAVSDLAVACTRENARPDSGQVVVTLALTPANEAPGIQGEGSSPGTDAIIACVRKRAQQKLRNPASVPAPMARVRVPLPLNTAGVTYGFVQAAPDAGAR